MDIEFVNHSSFIVRTQDVRLVCDPWCEGTAFNGSWALLSPTAFPYERFSEITHIWFSHEHPDHFSPPSLKKIPPEIRANIIVLYQETADRKVAEFCKKLGFKEVRELSADVWHRLGPDTEVMCSPFSAGDSWMCLRAEGRTILNLNDCFVYTHEEAQGIRDKIGGGPVDILATQFSLSAWEGNRDAVERRRRGAETMIRRMLVHCHVFEPKYVIPFASFVWFCHEENFHMNAEHNRIDDVARVIRERTSGTPLVMYPGDTWTYGAEPTSEQAIARYLRDVEGLPQRELTRTKSYDLDELAAAGEKFAAKLVEHSTPLRFRLHLCMQNLRRERARGSASWFKLLTILLAARIRPARIFLEDLGRSVSFDALAGLRPIEVPRAECDIALSTDSLMYGFQHLFGGEALQVNGRFEEMYPDGRLVLFDYFYTAINQNQGKAMTWSNMLGGLAGRLRARAFGWTRRGAPLF